MLKIAAISDTHNYHYLIPEFKEINSLGEDKEPLSGDILIHAGDATFWGDMKETETFLKWYGELNFKHIIFTPGNHDRYFEQNPTDARKMCEDNNVILLNHEAITLEGIKFFGSPYTPWYNDYAFNRARTLSESMLRRIPWIKDDWATMPEDINVLITHGPPLYILDELTTFQGTPLGQFLGCADLRDAVERIRPDLHFFGHIHQGHGQKHQEGISFYNVAICTWIGGPLNPVTILDYELET